MPTSNYPTSLDTTATQVTPTSSTDLDATGYEHDLVHGAASTALIALQTKLGISASPAASATAGYFLKHTGTGTTDWAALPADATAMPLAGGTFSGEVNFADELATRPQLKDYAEKVNAIGLTGGGTQDIDLTLGNSVTATVSASTNTFVFSNPTASDELCGFTLMLTAGSSQTVVWPSTVDWAGATAPALSATVDCLVFWTVDGGTIWNGSTVALNLS